MTSTGRADAALEEAIERVVVANEWTGVITGWVLLLGWVDVQGDNDTSGVGFILPSDHQAWPQTIGIIETGRARLLRDYLGDTPQ